MSAERRLTDDIWQMILAEPEPEWFKAEMDRIRKEIDKETIPLRSWDYRWWMKVGP